jgi:hypothetical protein
MMFNTNHLQQMDLPQSFALRKEKPTQAQNSQTIQNKENSKVSFKLDDD